MANKVIDPAPIIKQLADRCLKAKGLECSVLGRVIDLLKAAPAVDAVEVVHGHWGKTAVEAGDPYDGNSVFCFDVFQCSECGECFDVLDAFNYCPNCGAKMDGDGCE